jgi:hypothetical protein
MSQGCLPSCRFLFVVLGVLKFSMKHNVRCLYAGIAAITAAVHPGFAAEPSNLEQRLNDLESQNRALRQELDSQRQLIDDLKSRLPRQVEPEEEIAPPTPPALQLGRLHISGEGGIGYFHTGSQGQHPDGSFRVDEAKLFLEAPLWDSTYIFTELDLVIREANDEFFHLGELYIEFENLLRLWTDENFLSARIGRVDIPFGEEYLVRDVIDNPLISHSLSDLWGVDEGIELYGSALGFDYVIAVQNGGHPTLRDSDADKSIAGRLGYNFGNRARLSFSGMRTGELSTEGDELSELWFGNGFFRSLGPVESTRTFSATIYELDAQAFWKSGHLKLAGGYFQYDDSDANAARERDGQYYYAEVLQELTQKFYSAARFSQILADDGLPIVGHGDFGEYFYGQLTEDLWRLSIGFGYRWNEHLLAKIEYALERGDLADGSERDHHDFIGAELGFKF